MRKAILPLIASLALCGTATAALIATNAAAQSAATAPRKPVMMAMTATPSLGGLSAAPRAEGGPPPDEMRELAAHREQFCKDMVARRIGEMAYFEAKLALTPEQAPLFEQWKQASLQVARRHQDDCGAPRPETRTRPTLVDHMAEEETLLKQRLDDLQTERPPLAALYNALKPQQQAELTHGIKELMLMRGMMEHGGRGMMMGMVGAHMPPHGGIGPMEGPPEPPVR